MLFTHFNRFSTVVKLLAAVGLAVAWGCDKDKPTPAVTDRTIKIVALRGNNQRDTVGHVAADTVVVQVLRGTTPAPGYEVRFENGSCLGEPAGLLPLRTNTKGEARYRWRLSGAVGQQNLMVRAIDSAGVERAVATLGAMAVKPTHGWHPAACLPNGYTTALYQLPSGRILAGLYFDTHLYYSDDEGLTLQQLATTPGPRTIAAITATPQGEIFVATGATNESAGLYYSADNGQTWQNRATGINQPQNVQNMSYTRTGKLFVSTYSGGLSLSLDKGQTWQVANGGLSLADRYRDVVEQANGDLFVVAYANTLFKSTNGGLNWFPIHITPYSVWALFGDSNGDLYASVDRCNGYIYKSVNNGATWQNVYTTPPAPNAGCAVVDAITKVGNTFYFLLNGSGIGYTTNFSAVNYLQRPRPGHIFLPTRTHHILLDDLATSHLFYRLP